MLNSLLRTSMRDVLVRNDGVVFMNRIASFYKVSFDQFKSDMLNTGIWSLRTDADEQKKVYEEIVLPRRSTFGSAGYDIRSTTNFILQPGETIVVPTGVRCAINDGWFFMIVPRSGLGFKYRLQLDNSVGIIDSDYFYADNEGHIMAKITNDSRNSKTLEVKRGDRFVQGIFVPYGITLNDEVNSNRTGGFGSSGR